MYQRFSSINYYRVAATIPMPVHSPQSAFPKWVSALLPCVCRRLTKTSIAFLSYSLFQFGGLVCQHQDHRHNDDDPDNDDPGDDPDDDDDDKSVLCTVVHPSYDLCTD